MRIAVAATMTIAMFVAALPDIAPAKPAIPGEIVIKLDPARDFVATKPGWAVPNKTIFGCEVTTPNANKDPLASPPFTFAEVR
ncbi:MAG: hypothetical protein JNN30_11925 [Rhodanobacteraceae bacterium]|nr:hypothetical protein [Rhodanobacteraceae bacterium]